MLSETHKREDENLRSLCRRFGVVLSREQTYRLDIFLDELEEWNRKLNLTGLSSRQRIINELLIDSLMPSPFLHDEGSLLDVGSGAGFPAIPIKICKPRLRFHLVEPNSKKVSFLKHVIRLTRLQDIEVIKGHIEKGENLLDSVGYNAITSRGLAPLPQYLTVCAPHLTPGGLIVAFLGRDRESVLRESEEVMRKHRIFPFKSIPYSLPGKTSRRELLILKKRD